MPALITKTRCPGQDSAVQARVPVHGQIFPMASVLSVPGFVGGPEGGDPRFSEVTLGSSCGDPKLALR